MAQVTSRQHATFWPDWSVRSCFCHPNPQVLCIDAQGTWKLTEVWFLVQGMAQFVSLVFFFYTSAKTPCWLQEALDWK